MPAEAQEAGAGDVMPGDGLRSAGLFFAHTDVVSFSVDFVSLLPLYNGHFWSWVGACLPLISATLTVRRVGEIRVCVSETSITFYRRLAILTYGSISAALLIHCPFKLEVLDLIL